MLAFVGGIERLPKYIEAGTFSIALRTTNERVLNHDAMFEARSLHVEPSPKPKNDRLDGEFQLKVRTGIRVQDFRYRTPSAVLRSPG